LWRRPFIEFADDNAFVNRRYWKQLLPELKARKIRWFAETDLSFQEDADLLRLMSESGCAEVLLGFESPFHPQQMSAEELRRGFRDLAERLYSDQLTERRRANFENVYRAAAVSRGAFTS
jgi:hypothetical protein